MANNDLNQIRIFVQVAQLQSFTQAALALGIEKSTVSTKISHLESRLGIRLLQRTTRSVSLTEAGSQYLDYCQQALDALQTGDDFIQGLSQVPSGRLRVCAPDNLVDFIMSTVITPFLEQYPKVQLEFIQSGQEVDMIKDKFDIVLRASAQAIEDSSLIYRKIHHSQWVLVASKAHIEKYGQPQTPQQLMIHPSVGMVYEPGQGNDFFYWQNQKVVLRHRFAVNNMNSIIMAVKSDLGFAMVPKGMVSQALKQKALVQISADITIAPTSLYVVYPSRSGQPAKLKAFVDALVNWGKSMQPTQT